MTGNRTIIAGVTLVCALAGRVHAAGPPASTVAAFERLKMMSGIWSVVVTSDKPGAESPGEAEFRYQVTGGGSAVIETQFIGQPYEMTTVYHLDGTELVLTHYCAAGNQPRMKLVPSGDAKTLDFQFSGGANIVPGKSMHMHSARISIIDDDQATSDWVSWDKGAATGSKHFAMKRKK